MVATTAVVVVLATMGLILIRTVGSGSDTAPRNLAEEAAAQSAAALDPGLALPLTLADAGFDAGTTEEATAEQGPGAAGVCGQRPAVEGLQAWRANRLTDAAQQRRVGQMLARFRSATQASAFLSANDGLLGCERWETTIADGAVAFTATASPAPTGLGDEARQVDLASVGDGDRWYLRILLIRRGDQVLQLSYVSGSRADLDALGPLATTALAAL
ncbi:MAG: hypothetical protein R2761_20985 [Acidimicrobiales bacterium]